MLKVAHATPSALLARWRDSVFVLVVRTQLGPLDVAAAQPMAYDLIRDCSDGIRILVVFEPDARAAPEEVRAQEKRLIEDAGRSLRSLAVVFEAGQAQAATLGGNVMDAISVADVPVRAQAHATLQAACEWLFAEDPPAARADAAQLAAAIESNRRNGR
jgi:hypothetical protein